jgi:hypothetical protein
MIGVPGGALLTVGALSSEAGGCAAAPDEADFSAGDCAGVWDAAPGIADVF